MSLKNATHEYSTKNLPPRISEKVSKGFPGHKNGYVHAGADNWVMTRAYADFGEAIYTFEARSDDIYICTVPRSGTTLTQEMIWLITNDLDYKTASRVALNDRFTFLKFHFKPSEWRLESLHQQGKSNARVEEQFSSLCQYLSDLKTQRFIKTHLPMILMPSNISSVRSKVIYVARNPKDVAVSAYHFLKSSAFNFQGSFEEFADYFINDLGMNCL